MMIEQKQESKNRLQGTQRYTVPGTKTGPCAI